MVNLFFNVVFWYFFITLGVQTNFNIHKMADLMRQKAMAQVAKPWPELPVMPHVNHTEDPFITVKKNGRTYIVHRDRFNKAQGQAPRKSITKNQVFRDMDKAINLYADIANLIGK